MRKIVLTEEQFDAIDKMLNGVANRYANWGGISRDDIYQECWLKAMQIIEACGEVPDLNWICQCCYNRIFDLGRYQARRVNQIPIDISQFDRQEASSDQTSYFEEMEKHLPIGTDFLSEVILEEIENLFDADSNEREYIRELEIYIGIREVAKSKLASLFDFNSSMENEIALNLGFANSSSNGYRNVKRRVRAKVAEYLGLGENYNHRC